MHSTSLQIGLLKAQLSLSVAWRARSSAVDQEHSRPDDDGDAKKWTSGHSSQCRNAEIGLVWCCARLGWLVLRSGGRNRQQARAEGKGRQAGDEEAGQPYSGLGHTVPHFQVHFLFCRFSFFLSFF